MSADVKPYYIDCSSDELEVCYRFNEHPNHYYLSLIFFEQASDTEPSVFFEMDSHCQPISPIAKLNDCLKSIKFGADFFERVKRRFQLNYSTSNQVSQLSDLPSGSEGYSVLSNPLGITLIFFSGFLCDSGSTNTITHTYGDKPATKKQIEEALEFHKRLTKPINLIKNEDKPTVQNFIY